MLIGAESRPWTLQGTPIPLIVYRRTVYKEGASPLWEASQSNPALDATAWPCEAANMGRWIDIPGQLSRIERKINLLLQMESAMGKELDDLKAAVAAETTVGDSVVALLADISSRLNQALASGDTAALAALSTELTANQAKLAAAVLANTPAPPEPVPDPVVVDPPVPTV